jgi:hypothetical protein
MGLADVDQQDFLATVEAFFQFARGNLKLAHRAPGKISKNN